MLLDTFMWAMETAAGMTRWYMSNLGEVVMWAAVGDLAVWGLIVGVQRLRARRPTEPVGSPRSAQV